MFQIVPPDFINLGAQLGAQRQEKAWCPQMPPKAAEIRGFQPIDTLYRKSDDKGLYLEIRPNGSKHWFFKYRIHGSEKRLSLGTWPEVSLAVARERRDDARKKIREGDDPLHSRKMEKIRVRLSAGNSFQSVAEDLIAVRFVASKKAEATIEKARWYLSHLTPAIGPRPIDAIEPAELLVVLKKIEKAGKRETAVRTRAFASRVFRHGVSSRPDELTRWCLERSLRRDGHDPSCWRNS